MSTLIMQTVVCSQELNYIFHGRCNIWCQEDIVLKGTQCDT